MASGPVALKDLLDGNRSAFQVEAHPAGRVGSIDKHQHDCAPVREQKGDRPDAGLCGIGFGLYPLRAPGDVILELFQHVVGRGPFLLLGNVEPKPAAGGHRIAPVEREGDVPVDQYVVQAYSITERV